MKLITQDIQSKLLRNHALTDFANESIADKKAVVKLFNPMGAGTWFLFSMDKHGRAFGYAQITNGEYGYVDVNQLQEYKGTHGLGIERDLHYTPQTFAEISKQY